jgi:hypothetical protein
MKRFEIIFREVNDNEHTKFLNMLDERELRLMREALNTTNDHIQLMIAQAILDGFNNATIVEETKKLFNKA